MGATKKSGSCQPLFNLLAARDASGVHHLAVDHHTGRAHDAIAHDVAQLLDLFQLDRHAFSLGDLVNQGDGVLAVGTTGAEYLDMHDAPYALSLKKRSADQSTA